jgi:cytidylate kinase
MDQHRKIVIAVDGPSGAGKSTVASLLAQRLGVPYLDTGAMYRAVALLALRLGATVPLTAEVAERVRRIDVSGRLLVASDGAGGVAVTLDGEDVSAAIRSPDCAQMASAVSALPEVRAMLVRLQRELGRRGGGVVEGRDIGTVVFPDADLKVFLTASELARAERRASDLARQGRAVTVAEVQEQQRERDLRDSTRADSPLQVAPGAVVVDCTTMTAEEVVERLLGALENSLDSRGGNP